MRLRYGSRRSTQKDTVITGKTKEKRKHRQRAKEIFFSSLHNDLSKSRLGRERRRQRMVSK
tara:strand:- start:355 stop:537 length:183 start_codon:yes stop_codon:yes gene_type:complete